MLEKALSADSLVSRCSIIVEVISELESVKGLPNLKGKSAGK